MDMWSTLAVLQVRTACDIQTIGTCKSGRPKMLTMNVGLDGVYNG